MVNFLNAAGMDGSFIIMLVLMASNLILPLIPV